MFVCECTGPLHTWRDQRTVLSVVLLCVCVHRTIAHMERSEDRSECCVSMCLCVSAQDHGPLHTWRGQRMVLRVSLLTFPPEMGCLSFAAVCARLTGLWASRSSPVFCLPSPYSGIPIQDHRCMHRCIWLLRPDAGSQSSVPSTFLVSHVSVPPHFLRQDLLLNPQLTDWAVRAGARDPFIEVCYRAFSMGVGNLNPALFAFRTNTLQSLQSPQNYYFLVCNTVFHLT